MKILILIYSHTAQRWLWKLKYRYKNLHKDVLIKKHKQPDIFEDHNIFLNKIERLKSYIIEFNKNDARKFKAYFSDYVFKDNY